MKRWFALAAVALVVVALPASAAGLTGQYVECRTCDVWTGPCFANAEMIAGKNAVLGWKVEKGTLDGAKLDGLSVVAVVDASDTLGLEQTGPAKAILIVDEKANTAQRDALVKLAKQQGGDLLKNVIKVESAPITIDACLCKENGCAKLSAGTAKVETRCLDDQARQEVRQRVRLLPAAGEERQRPGRRRRRARLQRQGAQAHLEGERAPRRLRRDV